MKNKIYSKKSFFSKIIIKLARKFGYEVIDQAQFFVVSKNIDAKENLSESGKYSVTIPLGKTEITNKIKSLTVIIRSYTFGDINDGRVMLDQNKKRIFELPKIEYTLRTINSIIKSCEIAQSYFKDFRFKIIVTDDKSDNQNLERINKLLDKTSLDTSLISVGNNEFNDQIQKNDTENKEISKNMQSNMRNILKSIDISEKEDSDLFYFLEDDYIHTSDAITEILFTYEKISSQLKKDIFICPADYPYLYSNIDKSNIFLGNTKHWRTVKETLITFLTSKSMIKKYLSELKLMGQIRHHPMELKLHEIYEKEVCISPIPSLAMHATHINSIYGIPPNFEWKKIWDENEIND